MKRSSAKYRIALALIGIAIFIVYFSAGEFFNDKDDFSYSKEPYLYEMKNPKIERVLGFNRPVGIIKSPDQSRFYVSDFSGSVRIFDQDFNFISQFGEYGNLPGQFVESPHAVDFDSEGTLFVTDYGNKRIQKFTKDGEFISILDTGHELKGPSSAYFDKDYNLYVSDYGSNSLIKLSAKGEFLGWIGAREDSTLTDGWETTNNPSIKSREPGAFDRLHAAKVDSQGNIYVVDTGNDRIQRFTKEGKFNGWIGMREDGTLTDGWEMNGRSSKTKLPGGFDAPVAIDLTTRGNLVVMGYGNNRIQIFSPDGKFKGWWGGTEDSTVATEWEKEGLSREGAELGAVSYPYDVRVYGKTIYIADTNNKRILILEFSE